MSYEHRTWEELRLLWEAKGHKLDSIVEELQEKFGEKGFGRSTISEFSQTAKEAPAEVARFVWEELALLPDASPRKYEVVKLGLEKESSVDVDALAHRLGPLLAAPRVDAEQVADEVAARVGRLPDPEQFAEKVADEVVARMGTPPDPEQLAEKTAARVKPSLEELAARTRLALEEFAVRTRLALEEFAGRLKRDVEELGREVAKKLPRSPERLKADELAASIARRLGPLIAAAVQAGMRPARALPYAWLGFGAGVVVGVLATGLALRGRDTSGFHQRLVEEQQRCIRALDQLSHAQQSLLALLAQPPSPKAIEQVVKGGRAADPLAGKMGNNGPWKIPDKPYRWQKKGPCDPQGGEEEINGGCYVELAQHGPCPPHSFEHNNRCYKPVGDESPEPRSEDAGDGQAR